MEKITTFIEATPQNINNTFAKIADYAKTKGYEFEASNIPKLSESKFIFSMGRKLSFDSKKKMKKCRSFLTILDRKMTMRMANRFVYFMWHAVLKMDGTAPAVRYSKNERDIKDARRAWLDARKLADIAMVKYKTMKGDFYTSK